MGGERTGVGDSFVAEEDEEAFVGEEEMFVFLFQEGVDVLFAVDFFEVRLLLYFLL